MKDKTFKRLRFVLTGQVQGVGLRPALFRYAQRIGVGGWVMNSSEGTVLEVEGREEKVQLFSDQIRSNLPVHAQPGQIKMEVILPQGDREFKILKSRHAERSTLSIPPDLALCRNCAKELEEPFDRRYRYPFINCTSCGPRFTILKRIPYDRTNTTMSEFELCNDCANEYYDPGNRRFHAEPIACTQCGPYVTLIEGNKLTCKNEGAISRVMELLLSGKIVAIKSLGGFHLACLAREVRVVTELRKRKYRPDKPFALMVKNIRALSEFCDPTDSEIAVLQSSAAPIVMVKKRKNCRAQFLDLVSPGLDTVGVMLPYTPLHHLLFQSDIDLLVMTSGNRRDEPICKESEEAVVQLQGIADALLLHDRPIENRLDDSVVFVMGDKCYPIRRSRGFVPSPILLKFVSPIPVILSVGAELKNTFSILNDGAAYLSPHMGDLSDSSSLSYFEETFEKFRDILSLQPAVVAHDLHPDYLSTQWAKKYPANQRQIAVQHHHAHIASVIAEHQLQEPVIGVALDGTGMGTDHTIWGGEFLIVRGTEFERAAHLRQFPLPGGDSAVREIWRSAYGLVSDLLGVETAAHILPVQLQKYRADLERMLGNAVLSPKCSSMGRLFDAASYLIGLCENVTYEGQAAMELESKAELTSGLVRGSYHFRIDHHGNKLALDPSPMIVSILEDRRNCIKTELMAAKFHRAVVNVITDVVQILYQSSGIRKIALSGGCFQNRILLGNSCRDLNRLGFEVFTNEKVPANDGGISLGQAWVAAKILEKENVSCD